MAAGEIALLGIALLLGWRMPARLNRWLLEAERRASRFARRRVLAIAAAGLFPIAARLALLPAVPHPLHVVADEFTHLLIADTLASGRLSNPPHPMRDHFETAYALQTPSYAGIYPPAQGSAIALAQVLGFNPWVGIWIGMGLACAALCWMLQGWFPAPWALLGAAMTAILLGPWMHSHWGAPVAEAGGALVLGALVRIVQASSLQRRTAFVNSLIFAAGLFVLANSRLYEGFLFSLIPCAALALWIFRAGAWKRVALPLVLFCALGAAWTAYYNWRVTGDPLLLPYQLYRRSWGVPQSFLFEPAVPKPASIVVYRDLDDLYHAQRAAHDDAASWDGFRRSAARKLGEFARFYLHPLMAVPLLLLPWGLRRRRIQVLSGAVVLVLGGALLYVFFLPHYVAPIIAAWIALAVEGIRRLRTCRVGRRAVRVAAAGLLLAGLSGIAALNLFPAVVPERNYPAPMRGRAEVADRLASDGLKHLVLVRYLPDHVFHFGAIYNRADIDSSAIVWARELGPARDAALLRYYAGRTVWLFEPDETPPRLARYP